MTCPMLNRTGKHNENNSQNVTVFNAVTAILSTFGRRAETEVTLVTRGRGNSPCEYAYEIRPSPNRHGESSNDSHSDSSMNYDYGDYDPHSA